MFFSTSCNLGMNSRFNWLLSILKVTISLLIFSQLHFYRTIRSIPCCRAPTTGRGTPQSSRCRLRPAVASRKLEAVVRWRGVVLVSGAGAGAPLPQPARRPAPRSHWRLGALAARQTAGAGRRAAADGRTAKQAVAAGERRARGQRTAPPAGQPPGRVGWRPVRSQAATRGIPDWW